MKFLIQKIGGQIVHDFSFTLLESIRYNNWLRDYQLPHKKEITHKFINSFDVAEPNDIYPITPFKQYHYTQKYVPIGSVEFVNEFLAHFYGFVLTPTNIPTDLMKYKFTSRKVWNTTEKDTFIGQFFVKSNDYIKGVAGIFTDKEIKDLPEGSYQFSDVIMNIDSEWRAFVYDKKLVGLHNYAGDFTLFPNIESIKDMIEAYKSSPMAYTLDVGVTRAADYYKETYIIECHPMVSVGLYGFADHKILPHMFYKSFHEIIQKSK